MAEAGAFKRFHKVSIEFLDFASSSISDLRNSGQTTYSEKDINKNKNILMIFAPKQLIEDFIYYHEYWDNIVSKNEKFILEDVPVLYKHVPMDVNLLIFPYKFYKANPINGIITSEDIDTMWDYFISMVSISCNYIYNVRHKTDKNYWKEINVNKYASSLKFELKLDK